MIDADDLRDALIYGIQNALDQSHHDESQAARTLPPDQAYPQSCAAIAVRDALQSILDKLMGDWPPSRD
jgi:hypothetical protein